MELRHLRYFVTVAKELNFRRAAEILHMAQPPLSMQIKVLEGELGVQLFDRSARAVTLTPAGERFLIDARRVLAEAHRAETNAKRAAGGALGHLSIGFMLSTAHELLGDALRKFKQTYPDVELNLYDMTNSEQVRGLEQGRLDVAFTRSLIVRPNLESELLVEEPMMMMVPTSDPLSEKKRLTWKDLDGKAIVTLHPRHALGFYDTFFAKCQEAKISVTHGQYANDMHTEMWLVSIGMGLAPTSLTTTGFRRPNVSYCHLPADLPKVQTAMSWKKGDVFPAVTNFISIVRKLVKM